MTLFSRTGLGDQGGASLRCGREEEGFFHAKTRLELGGEAGSRTGGGAAEAPQRLGSGAGPGSLEGRLMGTGWNHIEWLE
jgi:hypothetical protein